MNVYAKEFNEVGNTNYFKEFNNWKFLTDVSGWSISRYPSGTYNVDDIILWDGDEGKFGGSVYVQKRPGDNTQLFVQQTITGFVDAQTYTYVAWCKMPAGQTGALTDFHNGASWHTASYSGNGKWQLIVRSFTKVNNGNVGFRMGIYTTTSSSCEAWFDLPRVFAGELTAKEIALLRKDISILNDKTIMANEFNEVSFSHAPIAYYKFNGNAKDYSGNGNDGTVVGATLTTDRFGNANSAYNFNGTSNYINFQANQINTNFTQTAWFKTNSVSTNHLIRQYIVTAQQNPPILGQYTFRERQGFMIVGNKIQAQYWIGEYSSNGFLESGTIEADTWYHIVFTGNSSGAKLYINGTEVDSSTDIPIATSVNQGLIGARRDANGSDYFNGIIDEVLILDIALSPAEVKTLYEDTRIKFMSSGTIHAKKMQEV